MEKLMTSQKYVRQLRPAQENFILPIDKVQSYLTESTGASTTFEGVIAACHNGSNNETKFKKEIMNDTYVKSFLGYVDKKWPVFGKTPKEQADILWNFSKICKKVLSGNSDAGGGQSKVKVSSPWKDITGKSLDTSKADISVGNNPTSVKGPIAQLMSGKKLEVKATLLAALEIAGAGDKLRKELMIEVEKFVDNTRTIGAKINSGVLKKMSVEDAKSSGNEEAKKIIDKQEDMRAAIANKFKSAFSDPKIGTAFAKESMMGWEKFGGKAFPPRGGNTGDVGGLATHMLIWDYRMDRLKYLKIDDKFCSITAKKMSVKPDLKSGSYKSKGKKAGYSFYQALRVSVKVVLDKTGEIKGSAAEEIQHHKNMLSEGQLNEFSFKKSVEKVMNWVRNKIQKLWSWLSERIAALVNYVMEVLTKGFHTILQVFELDVSASVTTEVRLT